MQGSRDLASLTVQRYQEIIDAVVGRVRGEFNQEGIDESVLDEVRALWEAKLVATGVVGEPSNEGQQVILQQQRMALPGGALPPAALSLALQQQRQQLLAMQAAGMQGGMPQMVAPGGQAANMAAMMQAQAMALQQAQAAARAAQAQQLAAQAGQAAQVGQAGQLKRPLEPSAAANMTAPKQARTIPQQDGPADDAGGEEGAEGGEEEAAAAGGTQAEEEDDDPLTEDDEASGDEVDEAAVSNVVLGQFEKVQRSKSKWKIVLKDCLLTLNGRDYLVRKMNGEMDFL